MHTILSARKSPVAFLLVAVALLLGAAAASAIESEGESFVRGRMVGNLGVAYANVGVYPDRGPDPVPERTSAATSISIPAGAEVVESLVYWAGRGPGWSDPEIQVNQTTVTPEVDYSWTWPGYTQTTYVADLADAGVTLVPGANLLSLDGLDHDGGRFYGVGVLVVYSHPELPEVELELLEGNEFAFQGETYFDDIGNGGTHAAVVCSEFAPALEDRALSVTARVMGIDAGRNDGPPRSQRYEWWTTSGAVVAPVTDGLVGIPTIAADGSIDNPVPPRVAPTGDWGSETFTTDAPVLAAGDTHFCGQLQSVDIGDGIGASLSLSDHAVTASSIYRLGNLVWVDVNENGQADPGEPGIDGVTVELRRVGEDTPIATTTTGDDGGYLFEGLVCGEYTVSIPGGQAAWTIAGEPVDPSDLAPGTIVSPTPDDDADNDNNGVAAGATVTSGPITIGDCGEDGDFSNGASAEPTDETDRVGGPDDDPDDLTPAEGNYDDVRSNTSIDFAFTPDGVTVEVDGDVECADEDEDPANDGDGAEPGEPCEDPAPCEDHGDAGNADAGEGAGEDDADVCDDPAACEDDGDAANAGDADVDDADGGNDAEACDDATPVCEDDGDAADANDNGDANDEGADADACDDPAPCEDAGDAANADDDGNAGNDGGDAADACDDATEDSCDDPGGDAANDPDDTCDGATDLTGDDPDPADETTPDDDADPGVTPEDPDDVEVEVLGEVEVNEEQQNQPEDLAVTGSSSVLFFLAALMVLVLGTWFAVAGIWMRPSR